MKIMMVCLGNICRSPMAHGLMQAKIDALDLSWQVDSSGTSSWHAGEKPDQRSVKVAAANGIDITQQRAQHFSKQDFGKYDYIIVMDASNYKDVLALASNDEEKSKVSMLLNYAYPNENRQVPDPYYSGGFPFVFGMIAQAVDGFIDKYHHGKG